MRGALSPYMLLQFLTINKSSTLLFTKMPPRRSIRIARAHERPGRPLAASEEITPTKDREMTPLLRLGRLVAGRLVKRPSATVRSPYVADVALDGAGTEDPLALAHAPALDVGGQCIEGSEVLLLPRTGAGKTSHSIELVRGAPLRPGSTGVLVGAQPRLGESIGKELLMRGYLKDELRDVLPIQLGPVTHLNDDRTSPKKKKARLEVGHDSLPSSQDGDGVEINLRREVVMGDSRVDFVMNLNDTEKKIAHQIVFEVKNVVCCDLKPGTAPAKSNPGHCIIEATDSGEGYARSALFPWGRVRGQDFEGRKVVSERACKHLRNLHHLMSENCTSVVLFIVNRSDCESIRACHEKCPVFANVLSEVVAAGVKAVGVRVRWTEEGDCYFDKLIPVLT